ncbi:methyl-accepting chemotaxis protein [Kushneria aurantia]|uniref:Methyl-accepting chemotaxis protein n=1 Tax=Kushneria aurantia TaxID=504092 RepID=A0ABV6G7T4_9GAMM|nr:methyl-accepting chemotaxis protein [Kushneria aurantia]
MTSRTGGIAPAESSYGESGAVLAKPAGRSRFALGSWSLRRRMYAILALMWLGMIALVVIMSLSARATLYEEREASLRDIVSMASSLFQRYAERVEAGEFSREEGLDRALGALSGMRFDGDNYIFAFDDQSRVLYHPRRERGQDMSGFTDPDGLAIYSELVDITRTSGSGFLDYRAARGAEGGPLLPKLAYVERFAPWGVNLAAGVYTNDIREAFLEKLITFGLILLVIGAVLTLAFVLLYRNIYRDLGGEPKYAIERVREIAEGHFDRPLALRGNDRSSLLFHIESMRAELAATIADIRSASESIDNGSREIAAGNNDLSSRTEQQAASLEETASSMEELTATVRQNADNAGQATQLSGQALEEMESGREVIGRVVTTMGEIHESSGRINEIITMIDSIAFQTNLLALNASVEAARAGEHGRGFAVVAGEVRNLASRSASAASEIRELIGRSVSQVESGSELVLEADSSINRIAESARRVNDLMSEIAAASKEQSNGIEQVNQAVTQMDQVTQQNAALVEEAAAAASSLEDQASRLYQSVSRFSI